MIFYKDPTWVTLQNDGAIYYNRQLKKMFMSGRETDGTVFVLFGMLIVKCPWSSYWNW